MSDAKSADPNVKRLPHSVDAPIDERTAGVIGALQDSLAKARAGEYRSVAIVAVSADGKAMPTTWNTASGDISTIIGMLAVLQHDLMDEGRGA